MVYLGILPAVCGNTTCHLTTLLIFLKISFVEGVRVCIVCESGKWKKKLFTSVSWMIPIRKKIRGLCIFTCFRNGSTSNVRVISPTNNECDCPCGCTGRIMHKSRYFFFTVGVSMGVSTVDCFSRDYLLTYLPIYLLTPTPLLRVITCSLLDPRPTRVSINGVPPTYTDWVDNGPLWVFTSISSDICHNTYFGISSTCP